MLPITSGVTMPDRFAEALNSPPTSPICPGGATSEITDQPEDDMACAKNDSESTAMTPASLSR